MVEGIAEESDSNSTLISVSVMQWYLSAAIINPLKNSSSPVNEGRGHTPPWLDRCTRRSVNLQEREREKEMIDCDH